MPKTLVKPVASLVLRSTATEVVKALYEIKSPAVPPKSVSTDVKVSGFVLV